MMTGSKIQDILVFLAVVEAGSFVVGGRRFGLSRSTAGKAIARLEDRYGARLLNRSTRSMSLTDEGRALYARGEAIRAAVDAADLTLSDTDGGTPRGTLRITAPDALGRKLLLPTLHRYLAAYPEVRCDLSLSDRRGRLIEDGHDLALRIGVTAPDDGLMSRTLRHEPALLCAAPSYLDARGRPATVEHLGPHDLLMFAADGSRQEWRLGTPEEGWTIARGQVRLRIDNAEGLREAALAGMGITLLPRSLVDQDLHSGRLEQVLPKVDSGQVPILVLYPHKRLLEPRVRHFIDMLQLDMKSGQA